VAVVPGDDAAPEAVHPALEVLRALELPVDWVVLPDGEALASLPPASRERMIRAAVDASDSVLFGATSGTTGGIAYLRWGRAAFANVRPIKWRPGLRSPLRAPEGVDYVIVRENLEDLYLGLEGDLWVLRDSGLDLRPWSGLVEIPAGYRPQESRDGRYAVKVITRENTERVAHFACRLALERGRAGHPGKVTCATKHNILPRSDGFFRDVVAGVVSEYPGLAYEEFIVDDFARRLVASPHDLDVVVLPNLYGDILSDEAAATVGGLGVVPSGCYGEDLAYFEPVHGTAPDIAGTGTINPTATLLSAAMMLEHLGFAEAATRLEAAVDGTIGAGDRLTPDQGGSAATADFTAAVRGRL
jgi:isocitrate/isopropylmalate dehydrogenase